jgi:hypothetical protein
MNWKQDLKYLANILLICLVSFTLYKKLLWEDQEKKMQ